MTTLFKAVKALKESGVDEKQAERIVEVISALQHSHYATGDDIRISTESIKSDLVSIKTDMEWLKKLILTIGVAVVIAATIYIFLG